MRPVAACTLLLILGSASLSAPEVALRIVREGRREPETYSDHVRALRAVPEGEARIVSADLVLAKARVILDGAAAAVDVHAEAGTERLKTGRKEFLVSLLEALLKRTDVSIETKNRAVGYVAGALVAGGESGLNLGAEVDAVIGDLLARLDADPVASYPSGAWGWTQRLERLHREQRALQTPLLLSLGESPPERFRRSLGSTPEQQFAVAKTISDTVARDKPLRAAWEKLQALAATLWGRRSALGPLDLEDVEDLASLRSENLFDVMARRSSDGLVEWRLLPQDFTRLEGPLGRAYQTAGGAQSGATVAQYLKLLRNGALKLETPQAGASLADWETYALGALALFGSTREAQALKATGVYRTRLEGPFGTPASYEAPSRPPRGLPRNALGLPVPAVEPLPTLYLREACAVSAFRRGLEGVFGSNSCQAMYGLRPDGSSSTVAVGPELRALEETLLGCYASACAGLKLDPTSSDELKQLALEEKVTYSADALAGLADKAEGWAREVLDDPDCARDVRSLAPVRLRLDGRVHCWSRYGVQLVEIEATSAAEPPTARPARFWASVTVEAESLWKRPLPRLAEVRERQEPPREPRGISAVVVRTAYTVAIVAAVGALLFVVWWQLQRQPTPQAVRRGTRRTRQVRRR